MTILADAICIAFLVCVGYLVWLSVTGPRTPEALRAKRRRTTARLDRIQAKGATKHERRLAKAIDLDELDRPHD